jgi:hypothetical protein
MKFRKVWYWGWSCGWEVEGQGIRPAFVPPNATGTSPDPIDPLRHNDERQQQPVAPSPSHHASNGSQVWNPQQRHQRGLVVSVRTAAQVPDVHDKIEWLWRGRSMRGRHSCFEEACRPKLPGARHINRGRSAPIRARQHALVFERNSYLRTGGRDRWDLRSGRSASERSRCAVKSTSVVRKHPGNMRSHNF